MAKETNLLTKLGSWAFIIGVGIALIAGIFSGASAQTKTVVTSILVVLGLIVGFLNVTGRETTPFLLAAVSLVIVTSPNLGGASFGGVDHVGPYLQGVLSSITTFVIPATIIVALKAIYALAHDE
jgi:hypothetical protein